MATGRVKRPKKNSAKTPTRIPSTGRGELRVGNPGNKGGGRKPEALRIKSREVFEKWLAWAAKKAVDPLTPADVMMQIGNTAGRYGIGTAITPMDTSGRTLTSFTLSLGGEGHAGDDS